MSKKNVVTPIAWGKTRSDGANDWRLRQRLKMAHYSRFVVFLKVVLPSVAALLIGLVILWPQLKAKKEGFSLTAADGVLDGRMEDQKMINPRFFTVDEKGEPINLVAKEAYEIPGEIRQVGMNDVTADILLKKDQWFALKAQTAVYNQGVDAVELKDQVNLFSQDGDELETTSLVVDLKKRDIKGTDKTYSRAEAIEIVSDGVEVKSQGEIVRFLGNVDVVLYPQEGG